MAAFTIDSFLNSINQRLERPIQVHLKNVYTCVAISTLAAAAGGYIHIFTDFLEGNLLTALIAIGFLVALAATPDHGKNRSMRLGFLTAFAFFSGLGLGPVLDLAIAVDPAIVPTAFLATCLVFICFSLSAIYSDHRKWIYIGGSLMSLLSMMFMLSLANLFLRSYLLFQAHLYLGLIIMCGFILYDTQLIIEKRRRGESDYIWHSVELFIDFIGVFRRLLIILTQKEHEKKNKKE